MGPEHRPEPDGLTTAVLWAGGPGGDPPGHGDLPEDDLMAALYFYETAVYLIREPRSEWETRTVALVDPADVTAALSKGMRLDTGLLPENSLWMTARPGGQSETALYVPARTRRVAVAAGAGEPPLRLEIPLPPQVFVCSPCGAPRVYAATSRPDLDDCQLYASPTLNTYQNGQTCPGNHQYPQEVGLIPDSFYASWFTPERTGNRASAQHEDEILELWKSLDGQGGYPQDDLIALCTLGEIRRNKERAT